MRYTVTSRREVPVQEVGTGMFTGRVSVVNNNHGGKKAVYVRLSNGFSAWGFAETFEAAELHAVTNAKQIDAA